MQGTERMIDTLFCQWMYYYSWNQALVAPPWAANSVVVGVTYSWDNIEGAAISHNFVFACLHWTYIVLYALWRCCYKTVPYLQLPGTICYYCKPATATPRRTSVHTVSEYSMTGAPQIGFFFQHTPHMLTFFAAQLAVCRLLCRCNDYYIYQRVLMCYR